MDALQPDPPTGTESDLTGGPHPANDHHPDQDGEPAAAMVAEALRPRPAQDTDASTGSFGVAGKLSTGRLRRTHVVVVGCGAVGAWVATYAASEGAKVTVIDDGLFNTYNVAAGWVMPYHATDPSAATWSLEAMKLWDQMRGNQIPLDSVTWEHTMLERANGAEKFTPAFKNLPNYRPLRRVATGLAEGFTARTPVAPAPLWHPVLLASLKALPTVQFIDRHVVNATELRGLAAELKADYVINATGITPALMLKDKLFSLQYGCVVHLKMPDGWDHGVRSRDLGVPARGYGLPGATSDPYYVTQRSRALIVVGGTMWPMRPDDALDLVESGFRVEDNIADGVLDRATHHFPELRGLERSDALCSIRPCRDEFLMKWDSEARNVYHVSGFGGSGVTLGPVVGLRVTMDLIDKVQQAATGC